MRIGQGYAMAKMGLSVADKHGHEAEKSEKNQITKTHASTALSALAKAIILPSHVDVLNLIFDLRATPSGLRWLQSQFPCHFPPCILYVLGICTTDIKLSRHACHDSSQSELNVAQSRTSNSFNLSRSSPLSVAGTVTGRRVSGHREIYKSGLLSSSSQQHLTPS